MKYVQITFEHDGQLFNIQYKPKSLRLDFPNAIPLPIVPRVVLTPITAPVKPVCSFYMDGLTVETDKVSVSMRTDRIWGLKAADNDFLQIVGDDIPQRTGRQRSGHIKAFWVDVLETWNNYATAVEYPSLGNWRTAYAKYYRLQKRVAALRTKKVDRILELLKNEDTETQRAAIRAMEMVVGASKENDEKVTTG